MKPLACPFCTSESLRVRDRRGVYRRRECMEPTCGERFSTREIVVSLHEPKHRAKVRGQMALGF